MHTTLLHRLGARDRALYQRILLKPERSATFRRLVIMLTHLGGPGVTVALAMWPLLAGGRFFALGRHALATLVLSHAIVQMVKRSIGRPRPSTTQPDLCLIADPDQFSFPSGHAAAALSLALAYSAAWPSLSVAIIALAAVVGASRIALGVHYPGDVAAGQALAYVTHFMLLRASI